MRRRINEKSKANMNALFNVEIDKTKLSPEVRTNLYVKNLKLEGYTVYFRTYLDNYQGTTALFYRNFRDAYVEFVVNQNWTEKKFTDVLVILSRDKKHLSFKSFISYGAKSDKGELYKSAFKELKEMEKALNEHIRDKR